MKKISAFAAIFFAMQLCAFSQAGIKGEVYDNADHSPLNGATIIIQDNFKTSRTDNNGNFYIPALKNGKQVMEVSYIGYETSKLEFTLSRDTAVIILLKKKSVLTDEIVIRAVRADYNSPVTSVKLNNEQIEERNLGQDITYIMSLTPSVVVTSDAGAGVGYTGMRIRGTDASRINVTINGIPVNDAESSGTFWVDIPDIASSVDNMQIQRGVGTSTNGAGAFGASLNIQTTKLNENPYATINSSFGSFNTLKNTVSFGSGLIDKKWAFDGRVSKLNSDGYIDRAFSDLKSFYVSGGYYGKKSILKLIVFSGKERTYQAWNGVPQDSLETHRKYNVYTYSNQTDNYQQDYYQLHYSFQLNKLWSLNAALHYTKGAGYYEEFRDDDPFSNYGLNNVIIGGDTITQTDLIRQRWLDNDFYGTTYSVSYDDHKKIQATIGGAANHYMGWHFGNVIWAQYASNSIPALKYYNDNATKNDGNIFGKITYQLTKKINVYGDIQYRSIYYSFYGFNDKLQNIQQAVNLNFWNPKAGLMFQINSSNTIYASYAVGNKEPNRDDYVQSTPASRPRPEHLQNVETGFTHKAGKWMLTANYYYMYYHDQLVLTGQLNDVGAYNRTNIDKSYRTGIEITADIRPVRKLNIQLNATFSENKILNFTEYLDNYDTLWNYVSQTANTYKKSDISFSPSVIAGGNTNYEVIKNGSISLISKYVSRQYLDNTSNPDRVIDPYFTNDIQFAYTIKTKYIREIRFTAMLINIFNTMYESNGWTWSYLNGGQKYTDNYYYPQAGRNYLAGVTLKF